MALDGLILFLGTRDLEANDRFYRRVLGLALDRDQGVCRIYAVRPGAYLGFCTHQAVTAASSPLITLLADDVDEVHRRLLAAGAEPDGPPRLNPRFGIYHFYVRDPDGYKVEVQRFVDKAA